MPRNTYNSRITAPNSPEPAASGSSQPRRRSGAEADSSPSKNAPADGQGKASSSVSPRQKSRPRRPSSDDDELSLSQPSSSSSALSSDSDEAAAPPARRSRGHGRRASPEPEETDEELSTDDEALRRAIAAEADGNSLLGSDSSSSSSSSESEAEDDSQDELRAEAYERAQRAAGLIPEDGDAGNDSDDDDVDSNGILAEEEMRIIADEEARELRKQRRARARLMFGAHVAGSGGESGGSDRSRAGSRAPRSRQASHAEDEQRNRRRQPPHPTSVSPATLRALRLGSLGYGDVLFEEQADFHSDSEPSFTDFFDGEDGSDGSSGSDDDGIESDGAGTGSERSDGDDEDLDALTTDDESASDLSALEAAILAGEPLVFGRAALDGANADSSLTGIVEVDDDDEFNSAENVAARALAAEQARREAEMPLLIIEDLDGRLIYARAGNGEAVFGSDGEFEYIGGEEETSSATDSDDDPYAYWSDIDENLIRALGPGADLPAAEGSASGGGAPAPQSAKARGKRRARGDASPSSRADGDTDDGETTDELPEEDLQFSRLLVGSIEPHGGRESRRRRALAMRSRKLSPAGQASSSAGDAEAKEKAKQAVPTTSGTHSRTDSGTLTASDLASDGAPVTPDEPAAQASAAGATSKKGENAPQAASVSGAPASTTAPRRPPPPETPGAKPMMGSFNASSNAKHRAFIDGQRAAPSPFSAHNRVRNKGLGLPGKRKRAADMDPSRKRHRRFSIDDIIGRPLAEAESTQGYMSTPEDNAEELDLDDVVDASMLWRPGPATSSEGEEAGAEDDGKGRKKQLGLNANAFARWNRVPMQSFRDSQRQQQQQQQEAASPMQMNHSRFVRELRKGLEGGSRRRGDASPFRGRDTRLAAAADQVGMDAMLTPTTLPPGSDPILSISPVLFPQSDTAHGSRSTSNSHSRSSGSLQATPLVEVPAFDLQSDTSRKITRREKREKQAKKAALREALQGGDQTAATAADAVHTPARAASPAAFLSASAPQLAISGASPVPSPLSAGAVPRLPTNRAQSPTADKTKLQVADFVLPSGIEAAPAENSSPNLGRVSSASMLPSSNSLAPLCSPLFGGVAPPSGLNDDLDEQPAETLMI